jgi:hypothetical protein
MKRILKWIGLLFIGFIALGLVIDATKSPEEKAVDAQKREQKQHQLEEEKRLKAKQELDALPAISANSLAAAYNENTVAADQKFKDKKFKVTGLVASINTDFMGDPYITLSGGVNQFMEPQFGFSKTEAERLANLKKGTKVSLVCVGKGDVAKIPMSGSCVLL